MHDLRSHAVVCTKNHRAIAHCVGVLAGRCWSSAEVVFWVGWWSQVPPSWKLHSSCSRREFLLKGRSGPTPSGWKNRMPQGKASFPKGSKSTALFWEGACTNKLEVSVRRDSKALNCFTFIQQTTYGGVLGDTRLSLRLGKDHILD